MRCAGISQNRMRWRVFVNAVMNIRAVQNMASFFSNTANIRFSGTLPHGVSQLLWIKFRALLMLNHAGHVATTVHYPLTVQWYIYAVPFMT